MTKQQLEELTSAALQPFVGVKHTAANRAQMEQTVRDTLTPYLPVGITINGIEFADNGGILINLDVGQICHVCNGMGGRHTEECLIPLAQAAEDVSRC